MDNPFEVKDLCVANIREERYGAVTYAEIRLESMRDEWMEAVRNLIIHGDVDEKVRDVASHVKFMSTDDGCVWLEEKIVIPFALREKVLSIAHQGHPGLNAMKRRLRERVWWPKMGIHAEKFLKDCKGCTLVSKGEPPEPLRRTILPDRPWTKLATDFFDVPSVGLKLLTLVDYYSRFLKIWILANKVAESVIEKWTEARVAHGHWKSLRTDNGPPFTSDLIKKWCEKEGIELEHSIPLWPQANGAIEVQHKGLLKALKVHQSENALRSITLKEWQQVIDTYVEAYNHTPNVMTGFPPMDLMHGRPMGSRLPDLRENLQRISDFEEVKETDWGMKMAGKEAADKSRHAKESEIVVGDHVLMEKRQENKLSTRFQDMPWKVISKEGPELTLKDVEGNIMKRASGAVKKVRRLTVEEVEAETVLSQRKSSDEDEEMQEKTAVDEELETNSATNDQRVSSRGRQIKNRKLMNLAVRDREN